MTASMTTLATPAIAWKPEPDGCGFFYATLVHAGHVFSLDLLPPDGEDHGHPVLRTIVPDPDLWIGFVDGVEILRAPTRGAAEEGLRAHVVEAVRLEVC